MKHFFTTIALLVAALTTLHAQEVDDKTITFGGNDHQNQRFR